MKHIRHLSLIALAVILGAQLYSSPPSWWWLAKPVVMAAWLAVTSLPPQAQLSLLAIAGMIAVLWVLLRHWGLHILLATFVLSYFLGFSAAINVLMYVLPALIIIRIVHGCYCLGRNYRWWGRSQIT